MRDDLDLEAGDEVELREPAPAARAQPRALVVEDDPELTRTCVAVLSRIGVRSDVVWSREDAMAALARGRGTLSFVYADARLLGTTCDGALSEIRRLRPSTPFVVASRAIGDVLVADGVVLCKGFTEEEFQAAFDAALFDEETRRVLLDAAEELGRIDAAEQARAADAAAAAGGDAVAAPSPVPADVVSCVAPAAADLLPLLSA